MNNLLFRCIFFLCFLNAYVCQAQKTGKLNLSELLRDHKLIKQPGKNLKALTDGNREGVSCGGLVWIKGVSFSSGIIDVDLRGKNVFQQSFLGIAFHGVDTVTYDAIYFRPFNFQSADTLRRKHTVQYISEPDFPWDRLRKEHPLVYENAVPPQLKPTEWFHARIEVNDDEITVYVNHSDVPALKVKKLNNRHDGLLGLWNDALDGDFANLVITYSK